jgi:hypothetical protein
MTRSHFALLGLALVGLSACTQSVTNATRPVALLAAENRVAYDLQCKKPDAKVLSSQVLPPRAMPGPSGSPDDFERAQFNIGISGCGETRTMTVMCSQENSCFTGDPTPPGQPG